MSLVAKSLLGKPDTVRLAVACFLAEGHLLVDDIPGVGKTTLAVALAKAVGGTFQRIQFTSDLLPSDIIGVSIFNPSSRAFEFKSGPLFHHVILADEINRASPKTQSALLEAMQERQVSVDNHTFSLPHPFFVVATQNPHDQHGTFPLPESQLDRFMMRLHIGYPESHVELDILRRGSDALLSTQGVPLTTPELLLSQINTIKSMPLDESLDRYLVDLANATRQSTHVQLGLSPRGTLALRRAAQGFAATYGRNYVTPDDIRRVSVSVISHRLRLKSSHLSGQSFANEEALVQEIIDQVPIPV